MRNIKGFLNFLLFVLFSLLLSSCASYSESNSALEDEGYTVPTAAHETPTGLNADTEAIHDSDDYTPARYADFSDIDFSARLPQHINTHGQKIILIDPKVHAWGAYDCNGNLIKAGLAACGADWNKETGKPCHTSVGTFHIVSLQNADCVSSIYPKPHGGGPMPYAMFFHGNIAIHGSPELMDDNISHGCVRISVSDAEWLRYNFAHVGTTVVVEPYH